MTDSDGTAAWGALSRIGRDTGRSGWTTGGAVRFLAGTGAVVGESISSAGAWRNGRTKSSCSFLGATVWASRDGTCSEGAGTSTVVSWSITSIRGAASTMGSVGFWCACGADCRVGKDGLYNRPCDAFGERHFPNSGGDRWSNVLRGLGWLHHRFRPFRFGHARGLRDNRLTDFFS